MQIQMIYAFLVVLSL
uniref:Uncharacterized protein n=1 Tax=Arundo donax TaxID=35708 RepID=A0A0A9G117_ARUDO